MTASEQPDFYMNPEGVRQSLAAFEDLRNTLQQETIVLQHALSDVEAGDPHGYLTKGLDHGYNAVQGGHRVVALFDELLRNAHATVNAVEAHDRAVDVAATAARIGSAHVAPLDPAAALSLSQSILTQGGLHTQALNAPTVLPGGSMLGEGSGEDGAAILSRVLFPRDGQALAVTSGLRKPDRRTI